MRTMLTIGACIAIAMVGGAVARITGAAEPLLSINGSGKLMNALEITKAGPYQEPIIPLKPMECPEGYVQCVPMTVIMTVGETVPPIPDNDHAAIEMEGSRLPCLLRYTDVCIIRANSLIIQ